MSKMTLAKEVKTGEWILVRASDLKESEKMQLAMRESGEWALVVLS